MATGLTNKKYFEGSPAKSSKGLGRTVMLKQAVPTEMMEIQQSLFQTLQRNKYLILQLPSALQSFLMSFSIVFQA